MADDWVVKKVCLSVPSTVGWKDDNSVEQKVAWKDS